MPKGVKKGDAFDVKVSCEKHAFYKDPPGASKRKVFIALCNMTDKSMTLETIDGGASKVEKKFKVSP